MTTMMIFLAMVGFAGAGVRAARRPMTDLDRKLSAVDTALDDRLKGHLQPTLAGRV